MSKRRASRARRFVTRGLLPLAFVLCASSTRADEGALERAKEYFRAGAQAYAVGEYAAAVQAFEQANALAPRPAVRFSIAQAERRLYFLDRDREHLRRAIQRYREYLREDPQGSRKVDAVQALSELEPLAAAVLREGAGSNGGTSGGATITTGGAMAPAAGAPAGSTAASSASPPSAAANARAPTPSAAGASTAGAVASGAAIGAQVASHGADSPTRVMVSSAAPEASISLDGRQGLPSPLIAEVVPGRHEARIAAPGFTDTVREVVAIKGALVTLDVGLVERPAKLVVVAPEGALLSIDGRVQGECPFPKPLELAAGPHLFTLTKNGYLGVSREEILPRGQEVVMRVPMARLPQRTAAVIMFGAGLSAFAGGAVFGYFSFERDSAARAFLDQQGKTVHTTENLDDYRAARDGRDSLRTASWLSVGAGALLVAGGGLLVLLDRRNAAPPPAAAATSAATGKRNAFSDALSVYPTPLLGPGIAGLGVAGSF